MDKTTEIVLFEAEDKEIKLYVPIEQDGIVITRHVNIIFSSVLVGSGRSVPCALPVSRCKHLENPGEHAAAGQG